MKGTAMEQNKAIEKYCNDLIMNMNAFRQMDPEEKQKRHEEVFPQECRKAFELGAALAAK